MSAYKILIVEDDEWLAEQFFRVLSKAEYNITITSNAMSAIDAIDEINPDVIILDMLLTGSTALGLLHEMQSYEDTGIIPIILCTNLADEISIKNLGPYGVRRIIDKTKMKPDDLLLALRDVMS